MASYVYTYNQISRSYFINWDRLSQDKPGILSHFIVESSPEGDESWLWYPEMQAYPLVLLSGGLAWEPRENHFP